MSSCRLKVSSSEDSGVPRGCLCAVYGMGQSRPELYERLVRLITETARNPFSCLGKPEPLRHQLKGCWSCRIDQEHRLVYRVTDEAIKILSCRDHY